MACSLGVYRAPQSLGTSDFCAVRSDRTRLLLFPETLVLSGTTLFATHLRQGLSQGGSIMKKLPMATLAAALLAASVPSLTTTAQARGFGFHGGGFGGFHGGGWGHGGWGHRGYG